MTDKPLVTVVTPAFNASDTIAATLMSVRCQTYEWLDIVIVDDGSTDDTARIVAGVAAQDSRVRLIRQANQGVAAARNTGAQAAKGDWLALLDADDIWKPDKIAKQMAALQRHPKASLVYCWHALIDTEDRIIDLSFRPTASGQAVAAMCLSNLVGSGSSALVSKAVYDAVGGSDPSLRENGAQGCEDLLLYFRAALAGDFALVPEHLTGYRQTPGAISGDPVRMLRSWALANRQMLALRPDLAPEVRTGYLDYAAKMLARALLARNLGAIGELARLLIWSNPLRVVGILIAEPIAGKLRRKPPVEDLGKFVIGGPG